jgi:hypothetical protein
MRRRDVCAGIVAAMALAAACADHLPDEDLRILSAPSGAKLSTDDLWKDFQKDPAAARRQYFGVAVDVSGKILSIDVAAGKPATILFSPADQHGVRARLLEERAAAIIKDAPVFTRITLRCFCEGMDAQQNVLLKSCIKP